MMGQKGLGDQNCCLELNSEADSASSTTENRVMHCFEIQITSSLKIQMMMKVSKNDFL